MKLFKKLKKGFTLVELVVVIAVIAILAALSVVSYIGVTNKAKAAADSEIITQLNTQMRAKSIMEGPNKTAYEAYLDAREIGFNLELMKPSSKGEFVWDQENDLFACVEVNEENKTLGKVIAEDKTTKFKNSAEKNWVFTSKIDPKAEYCQYLNSKDKNENLIQAVNPVVVKSGFDAGENYTVTEVKYDRSQETVKKEVTIRTNSFETELEVNASEDTIYCYGKAGSLNVIKCALKSIHIENDCTITFVEIAKGRVALEKGSKVEKLHFDAKTQEEFDDIIVAIDPSVTAPEYSRDEVTIGKDGVLVVELQKDTKNDANTKSDYMYLYEQGTISQIVATEQKVDGIHQDEETGKFYGYIEDSTTEVKTDVEEVKLGVGEKTQETQKAAVEIANNYKGSHGTTQTVGGKENVNVPELDEKGKIKTEDGKSFEETIAEAVEEKGLNETAKEEAKEASNYEKLFRIRKSTETLGCGESFQFVATGENVTWSIEKGTSGSISPDGLFTAISDDIGTCTVVAESNGKKLVCNVTTTWFHGGTGVESDPYQIANYHQWNLLKYIDLGYYYNGGYGYPVGEYFELVNDIDFEGTVPTATSYYSYSWTAHIDGKNHTIMNANGPVFDKGYVGSVTMKDLTFKNCNSDGAILAKWMSYATNCKQEFNNVDMVNCTANGGCLYIPWVYDASYVVTFDGCDVTNCTITEDAGSQGGASVFVSNSTNGVTINNCTVLATITATKYSGGFFIANNKGTIKNSVVKMGSIFYQKTATQSASAFGAACTNCQFYGTIYSKTSDKCNMQGFTTGYWCCSDSGYYASDFIISNDGSIKYTGEKVIEKVKFAQTFSLTRLYINTGRIDGGLGGMIEESELFTNIAQDQTITDAIHYINNVYNVTNGDNNESFTHVIDTLPNGLSFPAKDGAKWLVDGDSVYLDTSIRGSTGASQDYFAGTLVGDTSNNLKISVYIYIYDATDTLLDTLVLSYNVAL